MNPTIPSRVQNVPAYTIPETPYTENGIVAIEESKMLSDANLAMLKEASKGVMDGWHQTKIWRSESEMRFSVLNDMEHPTRGMKYLQARLEQSVHFQNLMYLSCDYEEKQGEIMLYRDQLLHEDKPGQVKILESKIRRCEWNLVEMKKYAHDRVREITSWEGIKLELDDGSFDKGNYDSIQYDGLLQRWKNELAGQNATPTPNGERIAMLTGCINAAERGKLA